MRMHYPELGLARICVLFGITRQSYYQHQWALMEYDTSESIVLAAVKEIRLKQPRLGGRKLYCLLADLLIDEQIKMGRDAFFDLLARNKLLVRKKKIHAHTTQSSHRFRKHKDLIKGQPSPLQSNRLWVSDITYLRTSVGFVYLSLITDAYSRMVVGYHVGKTLEAIHCITALKMALKGHQAPMPDLLHHSDRGSQYCCDEYVAQLLKKKIKISMTETGDPLDNAIAERVNGILKDEYLDTVQIKDYNHAKMLVNNTIYTYNHFRPHMSLDMATPIEVHSGKVKPKRLWKSSKKKVFLGITECV
jgi:putative transposase